MMKLKSACRLSGQGNDKGEKVVEIVERSVYVHKYCMLRRSLRYCLHFIGTKWTVQCYMMPYSLQNTFMNDLDQICY